MLRMHILRLGWTFENDKLWHQALSKNPDNSMLE